MSDIRPWLSTQTRAMHASVDEKAAAFDTSNAAGVEAMLVFLAQGMVPVERALERAGACVHYPAFALRTRRHLLPAVAGAPMPDIASEAEVWGAMYVLEGSRLGAAVLSHKAPLLAAHPFFQKRTPSFWKQFLADLGAADCRIADRVGMQQGAVRAFAAFLHDIDAPPQSMLADDVGVVA